MTPAALLAALIRHQLLLLPPGIQAA